MSRPATAYVQRAPAAVVNAPAASMASPSSALWALMIRVNVRPRKRSTVCSWTISTVNGKVTPLPNPESVIASAAIHTLGASAAPVVPAAHGTNPSG